MSFSFHLAQFWLLDCASGKKFCFSKARQSKSKNKNCWFSVSRHSKQIKIKMKNRSIDKVQNLGNERRYICKGRYPKKCFTQTYRDLYGGAILVLTWMSSNMAHGNQQKHLLPSFATKE